MINKLQKVSILIALCSIGTGYAVVSNNYISTLITMIAIISILNIIDSDKEDRFRIWIYFSAIFMVGLYLVSGSLMVNNVTRVLAIISYVPIVVCAIAISIEIIKKGFIHEQVKEYNYGFNSKVWYSIWYSNSVYRNFIWYIIWNNKDWG